MARSWFAPAGCTLACVFAAIFCTVPLAVASGEPPGGAGPPPRWEFPEESAEAWYIGSGDAAWAVSKRTGHVAGGWNPRTKERYLDFAVARYHLEDRDALQSSSEEGDEVVEASLASGNQEIRLVTRNPALRDIEVRKIYRPDGNRLVRKTIFVSSRRGTYFITCNTDVHLVPEYRDSGFYMGSAIGGGPLVPAPRLSAPLKITLHGTVNKGMLLSNPGRGYSFSHYRYRLDDIFVWPWWSSFGEAMNILYYTPTGWEMSLGTQKMLPEKETSYEEHFSIFSGDWHAFYSREYASLPEVKAELARIPPTADWVRDIKMTTDLADMNRLKRLIEMTDEGIVMVLWVAGGDWADYYVDKGLRGYNGGFITGEELRDVIERVKALSPRVKVGIYNWMNSTTRGSRIYASHPEWFRKYDKAGRVVSLFPGLLENYATMLNVPECYEELLRQVNLQFDYLGEDFVYLDGNFTSNMVAWDTGQMTRDDDWYKFFLDMKRAAAAHGSDKIIFMNGWGNPYADVNFVEARGLLSGAQWRDFSGMSLGIEAFLICRPESRIVPLYWTPALARDYVNRVLALGWIPSLQYGDEIKNRPFVTAAYEIGNCAPVAANYAPDWKKDRETNVESYFVKRNLGGHILSLISHDNEKRRCSIRVELDTLDLDPAKPVCVWGYRVEDASTFEGISTERFARQTYLETGWRLDLVTRPEIRYFGAYRKTLDLDVDLEPLQLYMLSVGNSPAAVYSEEGLPANFMFSTTRGVTVEGSVDWSTRAIEATVDSKRDSAEVIVLVPEGWGVEKTAFDGRPIVPQWVFLGGRPMPVLRLEKGVHTINIECGTHAVPRAASPLSASADGGFIRVDVRQAFMEPASVLLTLTREGRTLLSQTVRVEDGRCSIPLAAQPGGEYLIALNAVLGQNGNLASLLEAATTVSLPAVHPALELTSKEPPSFPERLETRDIGRTLKGIPVLRAATYTSASYIRGVQPGINPVTASVEPDRLWMEAGTTRKTTDMEGAAAFAGLEMKAPRKLKLRFRNTFFDAFHICGPRTHYVMYKRSKREFAGFVVDYRTPNGYTRRAALSVGFLGSDASVWSPLQPPPHPKSNVPGPPFGRGGDADVVADLGALIDEGPEKSLVLDLGLWAPPDWDGVIWFTVGTSGVAADRRLEVQILTPSEGAGEPDTALPTSPASPGSPSNRGKES